MAVENSREWSQGGSQRRGSRKCWLWLCPRPGGQLQTRPSFEMTQCSSPERVTQAFWPGPPGREDCAFGRGPLQLLTTRQGGLGPEVQQSQVFPLGSTWPGVLIFLNYTKDPVTRRSSQVGFAIIFTVALHCILFAGGKQTLHKVFRGRRLKTGTEKMLLSRTCRT